MRNNGEMKIVVFTRPDRDPTEHDGIIRLFESGLQILHIRKPTFGREEMDSFIRKIPQKYYDRIIMHSHHKLVFRYKLKGVHLQRKYTAFPLLLKLRMMIYKIRKPHITLTATFHSLKKLSDNTHHFNYVFLSPVFKSISKEEYGPGFILHDINDAIKASRLKVYALGGIDESKLELVREVGFHGVGLLGAIWDYPEPPKRLDIFKSLCAKVELPF